MLDQENTTDQKSKTNKGGHCSAFLFLVVACACIGSYMFGIDTGNVTGALNYTVTDFNIVDSPALQGLIVSSALIGCSIGSIGGWASDYLGRKTTLFFASFNFVVGSLLIFFANHISVLLIGRFIVGTGIGMSSIVVPIYLVEVSPNEIRGMISCCPQLLVWCGIFTSYLVDFMLCMLFPNELGETPPSSFWGYFESPWRLMLGVSVVPSVAMFFGLLVIPESPRWLRLHGRITKASAVEKSLSISRDLLEPETDVLVENATREEPKASGWSNLKEIVKGKGRFKGIRRTLLICLVLQMLQQGSGINAVIYYTPTILQEAGITSLFSGVDPYCSPILGTTLVYVWKLPAIFLAMKYIDRFGRRPLLMVGLSIMALSLVALSSIFFVLQNVDPVSWVGDTLSILAMILICVYGMAFVGALGPIPFIFGAEAFPNDVRGLCGAISGMVNWISNMIVSQLFPEFQSWFGLGFTFLLFATICFLGIAFVKFILPETSRVALEKVESVVTNNNTLPLI